VDPYFPRRAKLDDVSFLAAKAEVEFEGWLQDTWHLAPYLDAVSLHAQYSAKVERITESRADDMSADRSDGAAAEPSVAGAARERAHARRSLAQAFRVLLARALRSRGGGAESERGLEAIPPGRADATRRDIRKDIRIDTSAHVGVSEAPRDVSPQLP